GFAGGHQGAGRAFPGGAWGAAAPGARGRLSRPQGDRRLARLARRSIARSPPIQAEQRRLDVRDAYSVGSHETTMNTTFARASVLLVLAILLCAFTAEAAVGVTEIPGQDGDGPVTVYYPSSSEAQAL